MKWIVIGISGPTCSGKTSLAKKLHEYIENSVLISQDAYFLSEDDPKHTLIPELNHFNWEILSSLDMSRMYSDIQKIMESTTDDIIININKSRFLILEGFLIFNYKPVVDLCTHKYFIDINKEMCWDRRKDRVYIPPDIPGYFDKIVWPEYLKHKIEVTSNINLYKSINILDGEKNISELFELVKKELTNLYIEIKK